MSHTFLILKYLGVGGRSNIIQFMLIYHISFQLKSCSNKKIWDQIQSNITLRNEYVFHVLDKLLIAVSLY